MTAIGSIIERFKNATVSIIKGSAGTYTKGRFTAGPTTTVTQTVSIQPVSGKERQLLPEDIKTKNTVKIYSREQLKTTNVIGKIPADKVVYKGVSYEVAVSEDWQEHGGFYKAIAVQEGQG
jgi:hypothetical protein